MKICSDLQAYLGLSGYEKLRTYLEEDQAAKVPTVEDGGELVDLRTYDAAHLLTFHDTSQNYLLRAEAAARLLHAAHSLVCLGFRLEVYSAYRDYQRQHASFQRVSQAVRQEHPEWSDRAVWREVTQFCADPELCPPHLTGGAVDVRLVDLDGHVVDMGNAIDTLKAESHTFHSHLPPLALAHRKLLLAAMLQAEFAPLPTEWWHFSYGDKYWGAFYNRFAIFGTIKDHKNLYPESEQ